MSVLYLACAIVFTAIAQTSYKLYYRKQKIIYLVVTIILFCIVPVMTFLALKDLSLSVVYMSTGLTYVLVMLAAKYVLNEVIEKRQMFAVTLIVLGVMVFNF